MTEQRRAGSEIERLLGLLGSDWDTYAKITRLHREQLKRLKLGTDKGRSKPLYEQAGKPFGLRVSDMSDLYEGIVRAEDLVERVRSTYDAATRRLRYLEELEARVGAAVVEFESMTKERAHAGVDVAAVEQLALIQGHVSDEAIRKTVALLHEALGQQIAAVRTIASADTQTTMVRPVAGQRAKPATEETASRATRTNRRNTRG